MGELSISARYGKNPAWMQRQCMWNVSEEDLDRLIDGRVKLELLRSFGRLEADDEVRHGLAVAPDRVLGLNRAQFCHFTFVNLKKCRLD